MPTSRSFQAMLNEYLPLDLLKQEYMKRDYLMQKVDIDESWKGGQLVIPFEGQHASSIEFGQLAASNDISQYSYVRGTIASPPEAWASLVFNHRDLIEHDGKIPESTFLRILPGQVDGMMTYFKMVMSVHLLGGPHFAKATADGTSGGVLEVDRIDRFSLSQKVTLDDDNSPSADYYVIAINVNAKTVTLSATRGGTPADITAYTVSQNAKVYHPGAQGSPFTSLKSQLLSAANGGSTSLFGQTKLNFPFLQALNRSGVGITATNILDRIFDAYTERMIQGKGGKAPEVVMSFKHFGSILKLLEVAKGPYNVVPNSRKVSTYGWSEIEVGSVGGHVLKLVGVQECDDDIIYILDWDSIKFYTNGLFRRRKAPDGKEYFETRSTSGYSYILDHCIFGDLVVTAPWKNMVIHSIPNY
jgi:hypothetical protein